MTSKTTTTSISLPNELMAYLRQRAKQEDRPISTIVRQLLELGIMETAEQRHNQLVDTREPYKTAGDPYRQAGRTDI